MAADDKGSETAAPAVTDGIADTGADPAGQGDDGARRHRALSLLAAQVPYLAFLGVRFDWTEGRLRGVMPFQPMLIGNPAVPALHGGATASFLEMVAIAALLWPALPAEGEASALPPIPKTIDITIDYLRAGQPRDAFAEARVVRAGRRYANVQVEAWQEDRARPFARAGGHFLLSAAE